MDKAPAGIDREADRQSLSAGRNVSLALKENSEARHILIMNKNRAIGANREWTSKPSIAKNVVANPKTPLDVSLRLIGQLGEKNIKALTQNRNVPDALRNAAKHIWNSRKESK